MLLENQDKEREDRAGDVLRVLRGQGATCGLSKANYQVLHVMCIQVCFKPSILWMNSEAGGHSVISHHVYSRLF